MLKTLLNGVRSKSIDDIYTIGYFDTTMGEYHPDLHYVYIQIGTQVIEFESVAQNSKLSIKLINSIEFKSPIDEDDIKCKSSIGDLMLIALSLKDNVINKLTFHGLNEHKDYLLCDAVEMMAGNQMLFFDPGFLYGIGIGGKEQKEYWNENYKERFFELNRKFPIETSFDLSVL